MRILVPVDGSENSMHAVEFIASRTTCSVAILKLKF